MAGCMWSVMTGQCGSNWWLVHLSFNWSMAHTMPCSKPWRFHALVLHPSRSRLSTFPQQKVTISEALFNTLQIPRQCCMSSLVLASLNHVDWTNTQKALPFHNPWPLVIGGGCHLSARLTWLDSSFNLQFLLPTEIHLHLQPKLADLSNVVWMAWKVMLRKPGLPQPWPGSSLVWQSHRKYWHSLTQTLQNFRWNS